MTLCFTRTAIAVLRGRSLRGIKAVYVEAVYVEAVFMEVICSFSAFSVYIDTTVGFHVTLFHTNDLIKRNSW